MMQQLFRRKSVAQIEREAASGLSEAHQLPGHMRRVLGVRDLTFMGIAAIIGAGIFSTIGNASFHGGPGVVLLFLFVSAACGFSAVCYAEFASMVPVAGSAYTYSYVAFGEFIAWIIGWDLLMEYAIGNIAVAISWSDYFTSLLDNGIWIGGRQIHYHIPDFLTMDYWTAQKGGSATAIAAWDNAPRLGSLRIICDLPAFLITVLITWVIYRGIRESRKATNIMVVLKMAVIALVIVAGAFYVQPDNWQPFLPNGMSGVMAGTAAVFFSYIGFDAISTTAEECRNPQRDLPKAMFNSLIICTVVYILIALVLTGMVPYTDLNVGDPLAYVFHLMPGRWANVIAGVVSVSAVIATASVLLVFQLGQPRIWMSMSRDGLLPPIFARIHPRFKTPSFSTILTGIVVGIPALFMNLEEVVALTSVGTLFAFVLVCAGIIRLQQQRKKAMHLGAADVIDESGASAVVPVSRFKTPYINSRYIVPGLLVLGLLALGIWYPGGLGSFLDFSGPDGTISWDSISVKIPYLAFGLVFLVMAVLSFIHQYSLIPVLGFLSCSYLLSESGTTNWERFLLWLLLGLVIYFLYGYRNSKLGRNNKMLE